MTKTEILKIIPKEGRSIKSVNAFFLEINKCLVQKESVKIAYFGTFKVIKHNRKFGYNLNTKQRIKLKPKYIVKFYPSSRITRIINERNILEY